MNNDLSPEEFASLASQLIAQNGSFELLPHGTSMLPTIREGDSVIVAAADDIRRFDVLLYRRPRGQIILHRVIAVGKDGLTMRGDAQRRPEYGVSRDRVIGVVTAIRRGGRIYAPHSLGTRLINLRNSAFYRMYLLKQKIIRR